MTQWYFLSTFVSNIWGPGQPLARPRAVSLSLSLSLSDWRGFIAFDNTTQEPHRIFVFYPFPKKVEENDVIHAVEEFSDIAFQNETVGRTIPAYATGFLLQNINAFMRAKSDPAGKGCGDKSCGGRTRTCFGSLWGSPENLSQPSRASDAHERRQLIKRLAIINDFLTNCQRKELMRLWIHVSNRLRF
jgi:hypothetical protein